MNGVKLTTLLMIGTDCTGRCKSNYHTITLQHCVVPSLGLVQTQLLKHVCLAVWQVMCQGGGDLVWNQLTTLSH
jgi:hypothetical protein